MRFTEFELRRLTALRKKLDLEYEASVASSAWSSGLRFSSKNAH